MIFVRRTELHNLAAVADHHLQGLPAFRQIQIERAAPDVQAVEAVTLRTLHPDMAIVRIEERSGLRSQPR